VDMCQAFYAYSARLYAQLCINLVIRPSKHLLTLHFMLIMAYTSTHPNPKGPG
jgi:hypothetical protein